MKKTLSIAACALCMMLLIQCSEDKRSGPEQVLYELGFDRSEENDTCLIIFHKVDDFDVWRAAFDLASDERERMGIHAHRVLIGANDSNLAVVVSGVEDVQRARDYMTSLNLSEKMKMAGVREEMELFWIYSSLERREQNEMEHLIYMSFETKSYQKWEEYFVEDLLENKRQLFQVQNVYRSVNDTNEISFLFGLDDLAVIDQMEGDLSTKLKMLAAGVKSYPKIYALTEIRY